MKNKTQNTIKLRTISTLMMTLLIALTLGFGTTAANAQCDTVIGPPVDKDQCKNGGFMRFNNPTFRNQSQCVSYVNGRRP